jgi:serine/threonine-protein kinase
MATVYLARDIKHKRNVAIKVLRPDLGAVLGVDRFLSEIQVTANLQHPNLLPLFDSGEAGGLLFYVMPFVEGESLRARLDRERQLPIDEAVRIAVAVGNALDYAHRHHVIHRDLKPENILLHEGQPLVADFGIALAVTNAAGGRITQTGLSLGTPHYMSPEQATGDRVIDARSDIYSLGAVTYEMLTGEPPHTGATSQAIIARVLTEKPRPMRSTRPNIPLHVEAAVNHALEKLAPDRFDSVREFNDAITGARPPTWMTTAASATDQESSPIRRRIGVREMAAWSLAAAALVIAVFSLSRNRSKHETLVPAEFDLALPDSFTVGGSGAGFPLALSHDGKTLVIVGTYRGGSSLFVRRLDERTFQQIKGSEGGRSPSFSPDGTELLFTTPAGEIKRIPLEGGTPRTVATGAAFNGQTLWNDDHQVLYSTSSRLFMTSEDGGTPRLVAAPDSGRKHVGYGWPAKLPGGRAALITIWKGRLTLDSTRIGVVTLPEGKIIELGTFQGTNPRYSPPDRILYSTADRQLFSVQFSPSSLKLTGTPTLVAENISIGPGGYGAFDVSNNGTLAIYEGLADPLRTVVIVSRSGAETQLNLHPAYYQSPRVSPDGRQALVTIFRGSGGGGSAQSGPNPDIWRFQLQSPDLARITTDSMSQRPEWTSDGLGVVYVNRGDTVAMLRELYSTARPVAAVKVRRPLGIFQVALGPPHGYGIIRVDTTSGALVNDLYYFHQDSIDVTRPLMTERYDEGSPAISPNGQLIAYITNKTGQEEVYVRRFFGNGSEILVSSNGGLEPVWSPSGRELFYRSGGKMMSATIATTPDVSVTRRDSLFVDRYSRTNSFANYSVFPDGKRFLMIAPFAAATDRPLPIVVRVNWRARYDK